MEFKSKKWILLTGAGFSANFGGFLASEMWNRIFNFPKIKNNEKLLNLLRENFDFESVFSEVVKYGSTEEKELITEAIEYAYKSLDESIRNFQPSFAENKFWELLQLFRGTREEKGLFFTLNQDLLMERKNSNKEYHSVGSPFFPEKLYGQQEFEKSDYRRLPSDIGNLEKDFENSTGWVYIKLHGSYGWLSHEGQKQLVIGYNKAEQIEREPLLKFYFQIFKDAIKAGDKKILIIGYGFRDEHINDILLEGIERYNLKLFIIQPKQATDFRRDLYRQNLDRNKSIWHGTDGYFPYSFEKLFSHYFDTVEFDEIKATITNDL